LSRSHRPAELGLHGADLSALKFAALAHDIGERGMKRNYLLSPNAYDLGKSDWICGVIRFWANRLRRKSGCRGRRSCWFAGTTNGGTGKVIPTA
jgi:hypothetical protein